MGMGWPQQLDVRLDGKLQKRFTVGGDALAAPPQPATPVTVNLVSPAPPNEKGKNADWRRRGLEFACR